MADKKYSVDDILKIFNKLNKRIDELQCFVKECCAKIPVNVGTGFGLFKKLNQNKWEFKSLLPGTGISISETNNEVIITSTVPAVDCEDIDNCLGILPGGDPNKYLNEQGNWQTITIPPNFIDSISDTATVNLTVTGTTLSADFASMNISQFTNNSGYLNQAAADLLYYPLTNPSNFISLTSLSAGTGISYNNLTGVITNSAPDQIVTIGTTGSGLAVTGTYPNFTLQNTLPDQTVVLTQGGTTTITGTYPNFTISSADQFVGTVTSVAALTLGTTGTDLSSTVANGTTTPVITLNVPTASATNRGALSSADWSRFNSTPRIILSDTGTYTLTGTTAQTIMKEVLIPANTFTSGIIVVDYLITRVSGAGNNILSYINIGATSGTIGTQIVRNGNISPTAFWLRPNRTIAYKSATSTLSFNSTTAQSTEFGTAAVATTSTNIDWTINQYLQLTLTNQATGDTSSIQWITITHYP